MRPAKYVEVDDVRCPRCGAMNNTESISVAEWVYLGRPKTPRGSKARTKCSDCGFLGDAWMFINEARAAKKRGDN